MALLCRWWAIVLLLTVALFAAGEPAWKTKSVPEWTKEDARQVLDDSPWAKSVTPTINRTPDDGESGPGTSRRGGVGLGGVGIGLPGGMGRRGGYPGGGYPGGGWPRNGGGGDQTNHGAPPMLKIRWESALPVREAELKAGDTSAPTVDNDHYALAVYGVPSRLANPDDKGLMDRLKKEAALKREGQKDLKPSSVEVLQREDGPVIIYLFPRSKEITQQDHRVEFSARIGRLDLSQAFPIDDLVYQGKLEL